MARATIITTCAANSATKLEESANIAPARTVAAKAPRAIAIPPRRSVQAPPSRLNTICTTIGSAIRLPMAIPEKPSSRAYSGISMCVMPRAKFQVKALPK